MAHPRVSIVVPVFNGMAYLQQTWEAIQHQTHPGIEVVFVDGGSTDGSRAWVEQRQADGARVEFLAPGTPAATTWTRSCELATGEYVKLLCQDDLITPDAVALQVADLQAHPTAVMSAAQRDIISASGTVLYRNRGCGGLPTGEVSGRQALRVAYRRAQNIFGEPLAVTFRRDALLAHLPWIDTYPFMLDLEMYTRVLLDGSVVIRRQSIGAFRVSSSSWSTRLVNSQREQFQRWQHDLEGRMPERITATDRALAYTNLHAHSGARRLTYRWLNWRDDLS